MLQAFLERKDFKAGHLAQMLGWKNLPRKPPPSCLPDSSAVFLQMFGHADAHIQLCSAVCEGTPHPGTELD